MDNLRFSHIDNNNQAAMVNVSHKEIVKRIAIASGNIKLKSSTIELIKNNLINKGDVLSVAKLSGIMASKKTSNLIPLCHSLPLEHTELEFKINEDSIEIFSKVITTGKTGVEMEALTAVSISALTIYDMCKAVDKEMVIENIKLVNKIKLKPFKILSINTSSKKGEKKIPVNKACLIDDFGIKSDAHAGSPNRQVSFLDIKDIERIKQKGINISYGDFAENITTEGIDINKISIGSRIFIGDTELEVTKIGKECHNRCEIYQQVGDCAMPTNGFFAKVNKGGNISNESDCYYSI